MKVDYEMVVPDGGKYPEPEWYVWIDLDGTGVKRVRVPPEKIVDDYAPTGQAYAFVLGHTIQCFVRPQPRTYGAEDLPFVTHVASSRRKRMSIPLD